MLRLAEIQDKERKRKRLRENEGGREGVGSWKISRERKKRGCRGFETLEEKKGWELRR